MTSHPQDSATGPRWDDSHKSLFLCDAHLWCAQTLTRVSVLRAQRSTASQEPQRWRPTQDNTFGRKLRRKSPPASWLSFPLGACKSHISFGILNRSQDSRPMSQSDGRLEGFTTSWAGTLVTFLGNETAARQTCLHPIVLSRWASNTSQKQVTFGHEQIWFALNLCPFSFLASRAASVFVRSLHLIILSKSENQISKHFPPRINWELLASAQTFQ